MSYMALQETWGVLLLVLAIGYAILDGFDWGTGALFLCVKKDKDRRILLNAIGPVWDGNAVWLVTFGGVLFGAFPHAYSTIFSAFYIPLMLLLAALIFRAVSMEFRSKRPGSLWRKFWDFMFFSASVLAPIIFGAAIGNIVMGMPLDENFNHMGSPFIAFRPYAILVGVTTLALFMMHGSIYLMMKTGGDLQKRIRRWVFRTIIFFVICYFLTTVSTLIYFPHMLDRMRDRPHYAIFAVLAMLSIANIPREMTKGNEGRAFLSSSACIIFLFVLLAIGIAPDLVRSTVETGTHSLTIYNASSSHKTLGYLLVIAAIGMPLVIIYTSAIYRVFRGKVVLEDHSY